MDNQILELAKKLISIPSTKDNAAELKKVLGVAEKELEGFTLERFFDSGVPSLLAYSGIKRPEKFKVILNAHLDVVPGSNDQYVPYEQKGKLYGRGAYDMKAAAAAEIILFRNLARKLHFPIGLQLVSDEEVGGFHGTRLQMEKGVACDFILAGEPTDMLINNRAKGILWTKLKASGKSAHGAYPWNGSNAVWEVIRFIDQLKSKFPVPDAEVWKTTINLARIETPNSAFNKVPDYAEAWLDIRYIPGDKKELIANLKKTGAYDCAVETVLQEPAQFTSKNNRFVKQLGKETERIFGKKEFVDKHGGADIRFYTDKGVPGVTFGPVGGNLHSEREWVDFESVIIFYRILESFLTRLR